MKKVNQYMTAALNNQPTTSNAQKQQQLDLVDGLFLKFELIYGRKWLDQYPNNTLTDLVRDEWAHGLDGIPVEHISRGLRVCRDEMQWPPSIAEFRDACQNTTDWEHKSESYKIVRKDRLIDSDERKEKRKAARAAFLHEMKAKGLS